jgi:hypothetical protein
MRGRLRVPLYDPREAEPMRPLPPAVVERMRRRRTCFGCGTVNEIPFPHQHKEHGGECRPCWWKRTRAEAELRARTCTGCGLVAQESWPGGRCEPCAAARREELAAAERKAQAESRARVAAWAREVLADPAAVVFDSETTDLDGVMVRAAVVTRDGTALFDSCVNPLLPVSEEAFEVHGLSDEDLAAFEPFAAVWPELRAALEGRRVVIYNRRFDTRILVNDLARLPLDEWGVTRGFPDRPDAVEYDQWARGQAWVDGQRWECAMEAYSAWVGETWYGYGDQSWKWQPLPRPADAPHDAAGDCRLVWELLERLAQD